MDMNKMGGPHGPSLDPDAGALCLVQQLYLGLVPKSWLWQTLEAIAEFWSVNSRSRPHKCSKSLSLQHCLNGVFWCKHAGPAQHSLRIFKIGINRASRCILLECLMIPASSNRLEEPLQSNPIPLLLNSIKHPCCMVAHVNLLQKTLGDGIQLPQRLPSLSIQRQATEPHVLSYSCSTFNMLPEYLNH